MKAKTISTRIKGQKERVPKRIEPFRSTNTRESDLARYRIMSLELGATDAKIIKNDQIIIEDRVIGKCKIPQCSFYGTNRNCPPYAPAVEEMRRMVSEYEVGIFIMLQCAAEDVAGTKAFKEGRTVLSQKKMFEIISEVESQAFYDGYYLAMGFGSGPCKRALCPDVECRALIPGQSCRHHLHARPASEGVGINCYKMAALAGWDIYPIGKSLSPENVPHGTRLGLVLID